MALAKGHSSKTKSQVSNIRTIGPLVLCLVVCASKAKNQTKRKIIMKSFNQISDK